jgi:hypothetical protein
VHQFHAARVEQRPEVVEEVGPPPRELRRAGTEQRERGEGRGVGEDGGPADQAAEAVTHQVQRLAGLLAQHRGDVEDVRSQLRHRVARRVVGAGGFVLAALVERHHPVPGLGERGEERREVLLAPGVARDHQHGAADPVAAGVQRDQVTGAAGEGAVLRVVVGQLPQVVGGDGQGHGGGRGVAGHDHASQ